MRSSTRIGTTIFELVIVMAILVILSAIAIPRFVGAIGNSTLDQAARRIACDLRLAQANAIKTQQQRTVTIDVSNNTYTLVGMTLPDRASQAYVVSMSAPPYQGAKVKSVDLGGATTLTFDRFGGLSAPATIVIEVRNQQRSVTIAAGAGRITIE